MIDRLCAQRACLDWAAGRLARREPGLVVELGLGSGRTFDHMRQRLPARRLLVFDLELHADHAGNARLAAELPPWIERFLAPGGLLISNRAEMATAAMTALDLPAGAAPGHCFLFQLDA